MLFLPLLLCVILCVFKYFRKKYNNWKNRGIKQVDGILLKFFKRNRAIGELYKDIYDEYQTQNHVGIYIGIPVLIVKNVQDIQAIFQGSFKNFHSRGVAINPKDVLADNLVFIDDYCRWKLLRQKISPFLTDRMKLKNMFYIMDRCARDFTKFIEDKDIIQSGTFRILSHFTTSCIAGTLFGIDAYAQNTMDSPFIEMTRKMLEPSLINNLKSIFSTLLPNLSNFLNLKEFGKHEDFFVGIVKKVLRLRRSASEKRNDFIDLCRELQDQGTMVDSNTGYHLEPTDEVIAAQAFVFFLAGVDTSATVMHFTLLELASNPDILKKVHTEIDKIFDECNDNLTYEDIEKLNYLDMVLSESMRKYPPIAALPRKCMKSTTLPSGVHVKKDDLIIIPVFALHRDATFFPNPSQFNPERFTPENVSNIVKFSYLPSGGGNRVCIGVRFSRLQMKSGLAWLLRRYTLKEQKYDPKSFGPGFFILKDTKANIELIPRRNHNNI